MPHSDSSAKVMLREAAIRLGVCEGAMRKSRENTAALVGVLLGFDLEEAGDMEHWPITYCPGDPMVLGVQIEHKPTFRRVEAVFVGRCDREVYSLGGAIRRLPDPQDLKALPRIRRKPIANRSREQ